MAAEGNGAADEPQPRAPPPRLSASTMAGTSDIDASSVDGSGTSNGGGTVLTSQRRSLMPIKRVESRVPVREVQEQPLLHQARKLLQDQKAK